MAANKYKNHKFKDEVTRRIDAGESCQGISAWLREESDKQHDPDIYMSYLTILKIRRKRRAAEKDSGVVLNRQPTEKQLQKKDSKLKKLWETIDNCDDILKNSGKTIKIKTVKEWQYIDAQKQNALKLLAEIQGEKSVGNDITIVLSNFLREYQNREGILDGTVPSESNVSICADIFQAIPEASGVV